MYAPKVLWEVTPSLFSICGLGRADSTPKFRLAYNSHMVFWVTISGLVMSLWLFWSGMKAIRFTEIMRQTQAVLHARLNLKVHEHRELEKRQNTARVRAGQQTEVWAANQNNQNYLGPHSRDSGRPPVPCKFEFKFRNQCTSSATTWQRW